MKTQTLRHPQDPGFAAERGAAVGAPTQRVEFDRRVGLVYPAKPVRRAAHGSRRQVTGAAFGFLPVPGTRPKPLLGFLDELGSNRIAFDIAKNREQMIVFLDRKRLESSLPDVAAAAIVLMVAADMGVLQPVHPSAEVAVVGWLQDKVKMVGHQAEGQNRHRHLDAGMGDGLEEGLVIAVFVEDLASAIASVEDVVAKAARSGS